MSKKKKKQNNSANGNINKSVVEPVAEINEVIKADENDNTVLETAKENVLEESKDTVSEETDTVETVKEVVEDTAKEETEEKVSVEVSPSTPAKKSEYADRVKAVLEELDAEEDTDDGLEVTETAVMAEEAEKLKKERIKKRESERGNVFSFANGLNDKNKKLCVLVLYAVLALLAILIGVFGSKMPVVAVCVIVVFQVAFVVLLDENPIWLHLVVFALDIIAGLFTHHALFMLFAAFVYIGGVAVLEVLQRMNYKNKGKKRVEQA